MQDIPSSIMNTRRTLPTPTTTMKPQAKVDGRFALKILLVAILGMR